MQSPHRHACVGSLCGFRGTAEARANRKQKNRTFRQRVGALRECQAQKKNASGQVSAEGEAASGDSRTKPRGRVRPAAVTTARRAGSFGDLRGGC